ncbi:threonine/serine exporter family protein [Dolosigranulum savutiense]|uniref:Threonine/serine exporter family protein n=1 Tax=Dolosigranulum savutiense TaxID=3110288 RepID=A0AB74U3Z2_9LACT
MTEATTYQAEEALNICMDIGRLMLSNGAETYRVEDTMHRIATSFKLEHVNVFVVPTAIIMTTKNEVGADVTQLVRVTDRATNLEMVAELNQLSRDLSTQPKSPNEVRAYLYLLQMRIREFPPYLTVLLAAITTGFFPFLFGGSWPDIIPAFLAGGLGEFLFEYVNGSTNITFFAEVVAAFAIGLTAFTLYTLGLGENMNAIIISGVMTLVPGIAITNGIRDLMAGHLLAGVSTLAKALLTAGAIGVGIAVVLTFI